TFRFAAVPVGSYRLAAVGNQLASSAVAVDVGSGAAVNVTLTVIPPSAAENITVIGAAPVVDVRSPTTQTAVARRDIVETAGAERNRDADVALSYGSQRTTDDQFSIGDHSERFAWYASVNGNRTDRGLEAPIPRAIHDAARGFGAFTTLVAQPSDADQLRFVG